MSIDLPKNLPESVKDQELSEDDIRQLMENFRISLQKLDTGQKYYVMKRLKKKNPGKNLTAVTWPQVNAEIEVLRKINKMLSTIKKGGVVNVLDEIRESVAVVNLMDYGLEECETALKTKIEDLLMIDKIEKVREITRLFENYFDFTPEIKSIYLKCTKNGKTSDVADRIKDAFPEIDFCS